jgi:hypothetical protein
MGINTGPAVGLSGSGQRRAHWIQFDVADHLQEMEVILYQTGLEASLPESPTPSVAVIEVLHVVLALEPHRSAE